MKLLSRSTPLLAALVAWTATSSCGPARIYPVLDSPVHLDELDGDLLWPYGVHGGGHPEGHPGFDFYSSVQRDVYAPADGRVTLMIDNSIGGRNVYLNSNGLMIKFDHLTPRDGLTAGTNLKRGEAFGKLTLISGRYMIHFGVTNGVSDFCPARVLSAETLARLGMSASEPGTIMSGATYSEKTTEPELCNPI